MMKGKARPAPIWGVGRLNYRMSMMKGKAPDRWGFLTLGLCRSTFQPVLVDPGSPMYSRLFTKKLPEGNLKGS